MIVTTRGWTGAAIALTHADGSATFEVRTGDINNAYDVAINFRDWLDNGARPWNGSINSVALTVGSDGKRLRFEYAFTGSNPTFSSKTPNGAWIDRFGDTSLSPVGTCRASCAALPGTVRWERLDANAGSITRDGSWRMGSPFSAHRRPSVTACYTPSQSFARDEMLRLAVEPRRAYVYDEAAQLWRYVTLGPQEIEHPGGDATIQSATFEVLG